MADVVSEENIQTPDQNEPGTCKLSGFTSQKFEQTYLIKTSIAPTVRSNDLSTFNPTIYKIDMTDIKRWIDVAEIRAKTKGWQYWFPQKCGFEMTDLKAIQIQGTESVVKEIDKVSINVKTVTGSRAYLTPTYCYTLKELTGDIHKTMAAARLDAAENAYSTDGLALRSRR